MDCCSVRIGVFRGDRLHPSKNRHVENGSRCCDCPENLRCAGVRLSDRRHVGLFQPNWRDQCEFVGFSAPIRSIHRSIMDLLFPGSFLRRREQGRPHRKKQRSFSFPCGGIRRLYFPFRENGDGGNQFEPRHRYSHVRGASDGVRDSDSPRQAIKRSVGLATRDALLASFRYRHRSFMDAVLLRPVNRRGQRSRPNRQAIDFDIDSIRLLRFRRTAVKTIGNRTDDHRHRNHHLDRDLAVRKLAA